MKRKFSLSMLLLGIVLVAGCVQTSSPQIVVCPGIYALNHSLGFAITADQQAFDVLKEGWTYDSQGNTVWVEDRIRSDMTVDEALEKGLLILNQDIKLDSGETVKGVWMLVYKDKAVDQEGNVYLCTYKI